MSLLLFPKNIKGDILCFFCFSFLLCIMFICECKRSAKLIKTKSTVKGAGLHHRTQTLLKDLDIVTSHDITMPNIFLMSAEWLVSPPPPPTKPGKEWAEADVSYMCWKPLTNHNRVGQLTNHSRLDFIRRGGLKETGAKAKCFRQRLKRGAAAMTRRRKVMFYEH